MDYGQMYKVVFMEVERVLDEWDRLHETPEQMKLWAAAGRYFETQGKPSIAASFVAGAMWEAARAKLEAKEHPDPEGGMSLRHWPDQDDGARSLCGRDSHWRVAIRAEYVTCAECKAVMEGLAKP